MKLICVIFLSMLTGCATNQYRPAVDYGTPNGNYDDDLADCQNVANNVRVADSAAGGAAAGALFATLLGAAVGLRGNNLGQVAAAGAVSGGAQGLAYGSVEWTRVVNNCMRGRGYNVLN